MLNTTTTLTELSVDRLRSAAVEINFTSLLNSYFREFQNWHRFYGVPKYDPVIAKAFNSSGYKKHLKIELTTQELEIFVPLKHYSAAGRHLFHFPVLLRDLKTDEVKELWIEEFTTLIAKQATETYAETEGTVVLERLQNSVDNLELFLDKNKHRLAEINAPVQNFLQAETSLLAGHTVHPLPKGRSGFTANELVNYSPETQGNFQLHYFLASPEIVSEFSAEETLPTEVIKAELLQMNILDGIKELLAAHADHKVIFCHPFEARQLLKTEEVNSLMRAGQLLDLGPMGEIYHATSSVRTVYNAQSAWMYKFSLHVKITNSERVNLVRELHRGYDISRLLKTQWGSAIAYDFPEVEFVNDPSFYTVNFNGIPIEGFNTSVRRNPFQGEDANRNVSLVAALCQDGYFGEMSRLQKLITNEATRQNQSVERIAAEWFRQYIGVTVEPLISIYIKYGLACEAHQQNVMIELDSKGFPAKMYFRDNQGFFFREGKAEELLALLPDLADQSMSIIPEEFIHPKYTYYLFINNVLGVIAALGGQGLANEDDLLGILYTELSRLRNSDDTGLVDYVLNSRDWTAKANLLTNLHNMDEARQPMDNPAIYLEISNPLTRNYMSPALISPEGYGEAYSRTFDKEGITVSLRPVDLETDLEMLHQWFNEEHAKTIWKMDGPIRDLENFYRMLINSDHSHAFIGMINGEPTFTIEPYWPMRDLVGKYYDAKASDHGSHLLIAPTAKNKKYTFLIAQATMEFMFAQPEVGKCIGEASTESRAMHMVVSRIGFKFQRVIEMPHKNANLTFCERDWFWEKFPESKNYQYSAI